MVASGLFSSCATLAASSPIVARFRSLPELLGHCCQFRRLGLQVLKSRRQPDIRQLQGFFRHFTVRDVLLDSHKMSKNIARSWIGGNRQNLMH